MKIFEVIMRKYGFFILNLIFPTLFVNSADLIQGPYRISNDTASVKIEKNDDINCPLSMVIYDKLSHYELDEICENGDYPNLRSVFFFTLKGVNHIGTIVSWHNKHQAEGIDETNFEVKIYKKNAGGEYTFDKATSLDPVLSGTEDRAGDGAYKFNNAISVKKYVKERYG
ncbi:hypothetical protein [Aeromonas hydrophila]|uniref:hypothetical protein n=1 Tax=Aeromonas hydrophila TaxID=644 RepID=UPI000744B5E2|nr:hypothetical protein [Aeromonas hydrophila]ALZ80491.1 hypothetical protein AhyD4_13150 [Aeromonas hydrophila]EGX6957121.1 hypothetical protein [Aeromonas hydrophila]MCA4698394.1 hypothetical protein [Aeromonas hydrophila]MCO4221426.1 hypothetical protein [Aeromonas hydrophila]QIO18830.1 hypothetical protein G9455_13690 [Aeromonas hydrophila]